MTTSGVTTAQDTVQDIIRDALIELQIYSANKQPSAADMELGRRRLQWMLKEQDDDGAAMWRWDYEGFLSVTAGTAEIAVTPDMVDILDARIVLAGGVERALFRKEWSEFVDYPNKTTPGIPMIFVPKIGLDTLTLKLWPVPNVDVTILFTGARVSADVATLTETIDVPRQYTRTVMMNLAKVLAPAFGRASDPNTVLTIQEAFSLYKTMRGADRPASYFIQSAGAR